MGTKAILLFLCFSLMVWVWMLPLTQGQVTQGHYVVVMYKDINWKGARTTLLSFEKQCKDLPLPWRKKASSILVPNGNCIRVYTGLGCTGKSIAFVPHDTSEKNFVPLGYNDEIQSVRHCMWFDNGGKEKIQRRFWNEGSSSSSSGSEYDPRLIEIIIGPIPNLDVHGVHNAEGGPITQYQRGNNSRVEWLRADIYRHHLGTGTETDLNTRQYTRLMGLSGDDAGHIVARRLGGTGRDTYNIFPQSRNMNRGLWSRMEGRIANYVRENGYARVEYNLLYRTAISTRPYQLSFRVRDDGGYLLWDDLIVNDHVDQSDYSEDHEEMQIASNKFCSLNCLCNFHEMIYSNYNSD